MLRVQLANNLIGSIVLDQSEDGLDDPKGLDTLEQTVKRSDENDGVMYEITLSLDWAKRARSFIQTAYANAGIEAEIIVNVYEYDPNARKWNFYYTGKLDMTKYSISEVTATLPIQQVGFQRKVLNLLDVDVDLETQFSQGEKPLPATPIIDLEYHAKKIIKGFNGGPVDSNEFLQLDAYTVEFDDDNDDIYRDVVTIGQIDNSKQTQNDIRTSFTLPYGYIRIPGFKSNSQSVADYLLENPTERNEIFRADEAGVLRELIIKMRLKHRVSVTNTGGDVDICGSGILGNVIFQAWIEHRRQDDSVVSLTAIGDPWDTPGCGGSSRESDFETKEYVLNNVPILLGDKIYVFFTARIFGTYEEPHEGPAGHGFLHHSFQVTADSDNTFVKFTVETEFPATSHKTVMVYEAINKMVQYYTDQINSFKSDFFGRTDTVPPYPADGKGSLMGVTVGRILRDLANKTIFWNMDDAFKSLSSIWCLGAGFETIDGVQKFVIEEKPYFYNRDLKILELGPVNDLKKEVALKYYYSQVEIGYPKLDAGQINGIDEANTVRRYAAPLTQAKNKLSLKSLAKTSGYEIESQRRLQNQTSDSRNDDSVFLTMLLRAVSGFQTARNQNFPIVNNLFDPDSAYNLEITPTRNALRWLQVLAAPLWAVVDKIYKFSYGETNYQMESQRFDEMAPVKEGQNLDANSVIPLWYPETYSFTHPLTREQFSVVRTLPYGYIEFQDTLQNKLEGYILEVSHKPNEKLGTFKLLRVFR